MEKQVERLRAVLQRHFKLDEDPVPLKRARATESLQDPARGILRQIAFFGASSTNRFVDVRIVLSLQFFSKLNHLECQTLAQLRARRHLTAATCRWNRVRGQPDLQCEDCQAASSDQACAYNGSGGHDDAAVFRCSAQFPYDFAVGIPFIAASSNGCRSA